MSCYRYGENFNECMYDSVCTISSENELIGTILSHGHLDAIVVEGYDGVGKGRILNILSKYYQITPYRPDYNLWNKFNLSKSDRWKISGFFWDIYSHFGCHNYKPMLFDRGVISGAVYNQDMSISEHYKELLRDMKVLHILVVCDKESYAKFMKIRNPDIADSDVDYFYIQYNKYTQDYLEVLREAEVDYICYNNHYSEELANNISSKCESCGHYSYGWCRHPVMNCGVDPNKERCELSLDEEVQDVNDEQMHIM